jgi:hypothetical protein
MQTVDRALAWARGAGWLEVTSRGHRINDERTHASAYRLWLPDPSPQTNEELASDPSPQNGRPKSSKREANSSHQWGPKRSLPVGPLQEVQQPRARARKDIETRAEVTADEAEEIMTALAAEAEGKGRRVAKWDLYVAAIPPDELRDRLPWSIDRQQTEEFYKPF